MLHGPVHRQDPLRKPPDRRAGAGAGCGAGPSAPLRSVQEELARRRLPGPLCRYPGRRLVTRPRPRPFAAFSPYLALYIAFPTASPTNSRVCFSPGPLCGRFCAQFAVTRGAHLWVPAPRFFAPSLRRHTN